MDEMYYQCQSCLNQRVRVYMSSGQEYEGVLVNVDYQNVYLETDPYAYISSKQVTTKAFGFGGRFITTLVLFDLLAIALLV
jgi:small nuclear ribonucleoprotein (snRNP)-like protein